MTSSLDFVLSALLDLLNGLLPESLKLLALVLAELGGKFDLGLERVVVSQLLDLPIRAAAVGATRGFSDLVLLIEHLVIRLPLFLFRLQLHVLHVELVHPVVRHFLRS